MIAILLMLTAEVPLPQLVTGANLVPVGDARRGYGTKKSKETIERLKKLGVNTVSVLMEGRSRDLRDTSIHIPELEPIEEQLAQAASLGMATILIPHIYLDDGSWRGDLDFTNAIAREEWWASYRAFILAAARIAASSKTTVLSIGVELKAMSKQPEVAARMFQLARDVRREYRGLLTYSANWDEAEAVSFWGAVDIAGVNGYYPLLPDPVRGAEAVARRLLALAVIAKKEVLVVEVGYRSSPLSNVKPWEWPSKLEVIVDDGSQASCWAAVLTAWLGLPNVRGLLVWVIPTDPDDPASEPRHGFNPLNKPAEQVIARAFRGSA